MSDRNDDSKNADYEVGYKRPPRRTQFKKGKSGNPKGRPRKSKNFETDVRETLNLPVPVTENGRRRTISTQQANLLRLREQALKGNAKAMDRLLALAAAHNSEALLKDAEPALSAADKAIVDAYVERRGAARAGDEPESGQ